MTLSTTTADSIEIDNGPERPTTAPSLPDLFERYRTASHEEAPGLLWAIADRSNFSYPFPYHRPVLMYLTRVAREKDPWEPNEELRVEARKVILRQLVSKLLAKPGDALHDSERYDAMQCVTFFAEDEMHCGFRGRDRDTLVAFLKRYMDLVDARFGGHYTQHSCILWACVYAGALELLKRATPEAVIPVLQKHLFDKLTDTSGWEDRYPLNIVPPVYGIGTSEQVTALCRTVLNNSYRSALHEHAKMLVTLRACAD